MTNDGSGSVFRALADPTRRQILQDLRLRAPPGHRVAAGDSRRREAVSRLAPPCDVHGGRVRRPVPGGDDKPRRTGADAVAAHVADLVAPGSVFGDLESASRFFGGSPVGYSSRPGGAAFDGVRLDCHGWSLQPLAVDDAASSYFDDVGRFPLGSVAFDSAFLMHELDTTWSALPALPAQRVRAGVRPGWSPRTALPARPRRRHGP